MQPSDLDFYSTKELVAELVRRKTFLGVVIHAEDEHRGKPWGEEKIFKVHFNDNLSAEQTGRLLGSITEHLNR